MNRFSFLGRTAFAVWLLLATNCLAQSKDITVASQDVAHAAKVAYPGTPGMVAPPKKSSASSSEGPDRLRRWEIEFHGGGMFSSNPDGGKAALPAAGATFTDAAAAPTRPVSSWMFGDGTVLYNDFSAASGGAMTTTMTPLDPVITRQVGERKSGAGTGFRLGVDLNKRFGIEWSTDYTWTPVELKKSFLTGLEATRASFGSTFTDLVNNYCGCSGGGDAISDTRRRSEGGQLFNTLAANIYLKTSGKLIPYITAGGGFVSNVGPNPHAAILGHYVLSGAAENTDTVNVVARTSGTQGLGLVGIGAKYYATPHWGLRFDFRDHLMGNGLSTTVDANPVATTDTFGPTSPGTTPDIQFGSTTGQPDSLSGPALSKFRTFKGDGVRNQFGFNVGVFFRF
jgi:hypothetical protein